MVSTPPPLSNIKYGMTICELQIHIFHGSFDSSTLANKQTNEFIYGVMSAVDKIRYFAVRCSVSRMTV